MRVMVAGPSPHITTGYGLQTAALLKRLIAAGHEVALMSFFGHEGARGLEAPVQTVNGPSKLTIYSRMGDYGGNDVIIDHVNDFGADIVITLLNTWLLPNYTDVVIRWIPWVPFEGEPLDTHSQKYLKSAFRVVAISEYGRHWIEDAGISCTSIPHGIEDVFRPNLEAAKTFRERHGIPEQAHLIGMVGINRYFPCRKGYEQAFEAFSEVMKTREVYLYAHANPTPFDGSNDLLEVAKFFGISDRLRLPFRYQYYGKYPAEEMAGMYTAFDCLVQSTHGEGFGLPVVEAQACGTPVIATDCTTMPELVCPGAGRLVPWVSRYLRPGMFWNYQPDVKDLVEGMRWGLDNGLDPQIRNQCVEWAEQWRWDKIWQEKWVPFLAEVEEAVAADTWRDRDFPRVLNLGCGSDPIAGAVNHDLTLHSSFVNVAWDLNETPWPWEDDSFDLVIAQDVLEHLRPELLEIMGQLWRILAPKGLLRIRAPLADSLLAFGDPTHLKAFTIETFCYFDPRTGGGQKYGFYDERKWHLRHRRVERGNLLVEMTPIKE